MGGRSRAQTVGFRYRLGMHLVLCQGPVDAVQEIQMGERTVWGDASREWLPTGHGLGSHAINLPELFGGDSREGGVVGTIDLLSGDASQGRNDYLQSQLGADIPAFRGVLSLVARRILFAANNPYIKPWAVRVRRRADVQGGDGWVGMNPADIIVECLTNAQWGMGYPESRIGASVWEARWTLDIEGFGLNFLWTRQQPIESFIAQVLDHINGILYVHPEHGTFELKLLRAPSQPHCLPMLGPNEIVRVERFERAQWGELPNEITVVYTDWQTGGEATVTVENLAAIQLQGGVINQRRDYPGVNHQPLAARLALRDLRALGTPLARMTLIVAPSQLPVQPLPGDLFTLHWPRLGVERLIVRVLGIDTGSLGAGEWRIEAVEDVFSMDNAVLTAAAPPPVDTTPQPMPPALVLALEVPYWDIARSFSRADLAQVTSTDTYLGALAAAGGAGQWNWRLHTGASSGQLNAVTDGDYAPLFTLPNALPRSEADATVAVSAVSNPQRLAVGDVAYLVTASGAVTEAVAVLAYDAAGATVTLARGVLDTTPQAHAAGVRLIGAGQWLASEGMERAPGESVFVGAAPRTGSGMGGVTLALNGQPLTLTGRQAMPYAPGRVRFNGAIDPASLSGNLTVTWAHRDRIQQTAYLVRQDEGDIGPESGVTYTVRVLNAVGAVIHSATGLSGTAHVWVGAGAAIQAGTHGNRLTFEVSAQRGNIDNWQPQVRIMDRIGGVLVWS